MSMKIVKTTNDGVNFFGVISEQIIVDNLEAVRTFNRCQESFGHLDKAYTEKLAEMQQSIANINEDGSKKDEEQKSKEIAEEAAKYKALAEAPVEFEMSHENIRFFSNAILRVIEETKLKSSDRMGIKGIGLIRDVEIAINQLEDAIDTE